MTKDDIIRMAREAGFEKVVAIHPDGAKTVTVAPVPELLAFANLVVAAEREACAGLAERRLLIDKSSAKKTGHHYACKSILADIQARGTT